MKSKEEIVNKIEEFRNHEQYQEIKKRHKDSWTTEEAMLVIGIESIMEFLGWVIE